MAEQGAVSLVLRDAFRAWLDAALDVLSGRDVPGVDQVEISLQGGMRHGTYIVVPDYLEFALLNSEALSDLAETEAVLEVVRADPELRAVLLADRSGAARQLEAEKSWLVIERLVPFIAAVLARARDAARTDMTTTVDALFAQVYDQFDVSIYRFETIPVMWLVQFANLRLEVDDFELEPGVRLRRPTEREHILATQVRFGSLLGQPSHPSQMITNPARAMDIPDPWEMPDVFLEFADHRHFPRSHLSGAAAVSLAERMLTALRLVNDTAVGIHSIWYIDENPFDSFPMPRRPWHDPIPSDNIAAQYVVTPYVEGQVRELWPHLDEGLIGPVLSLGLRRLNDSYHRARPEDRLIDYWVALEALFLRVNEGELRYRAALLTARFIGTDPVERLRLFGEFRASYDLRSKVVHGATLPPPNRVRETTEHTGTVLRRVLRTCVADRQPPDLDQVLRNLLA